MRKPQEVTPRVLDLNNNLNALAKKCVLKQEGWGSRYIKGRRKGKKRKLFKLDEKGLAEILKVMQSYIWRAVTNSRGFYDEDLAAHIRSAIWKLLRFEGHADFASLVKLRIMNICTTEHNIKVRGLKRNVNITAVSYYNEYGSEEGDMIMLDKIADPHQEDGTPLALLDNKERIVYQELMSMNVDGKISREDKKYYKEFINTNHNVLVNIYQKIA